MKLRKKKKFLQSNWTGTKSILPLSTGMLLSQDEGNKK